MYSKKARKFLSSHDAKIGDIVKYERDGLEIDGLLLPNPSSGDDNCLILKLSSGYNMGLSSEGAKLEVIAKKEFDFSRGEKRMQKSLSKSGKNHITLISTGGTIASRVDYKTGAVDAKLDAKEIVSSYPSLSKFEPIEVLPLMNILSEDMTPKHWSKIATEVKSAIDNGAKGIVISHGTDTLGYTASALAYALQGVKVPVILTGAQRSPDRASSDASQNIFCSMAVARSKLNGVYVCMHASTNDDFNHLHFATRARKCHSSGRWAFKSVGVSPVAKIDARSGEIKTQASSFSSSQSLELKTKFSDNVHMAWAYPGISAKTVDGWSKYDGVVISGTGLGHITNEVHKELEKLISKDILIAMAPQTLEGRIMLETYSTGRKLDDIGIIGNGCDWLAETAYVKMCWALGQTKSVKKAKEMMLTPVANDITEFSVVKTDE